MSESCKECRFFGKARDVFGRVSDHCRRKHVFVPHEPTDWCGEFKCDPDFEVKPSAPFSNRSVDLHEKKDAVRGVNTFADLINKRLAETGNTSATVRRDECVKFFNNVVKL